MRAKTALLFLLVLVGSRAPLWTQQAEPTAVRTDKTVFVAGQLTDEDLLVFTAAVAARGSQGVVLFDTPTSAAPTKGFLAAFRPERVVPVGSFADGSAGLGRRLGVSPAPALEWQQGRPVALWQTLFPKAQRVVVCPTEPRGQLLQAACLAGTADAPLFVTRGEANEGADLRRWLTTWQTREVLAVGRAVELCRGLPEVSRTELADEQTVAAAYLRYQQAKGPIRALVVANAADQGKELGGMSALAPWVTLQRRAALRLTNSTGKNATAVVQAALANPALREADALILVANRKAIPTEHRPNPVAGKDTSIEMEPFTPQGQEPYTFATGRLFHADRNVVALMLARQRLLAGRPAPRKALVVSNPGGGLPLLEVFSRQTAKELHNRGYQCTALFEKEASPARLRQLLPEQDIFLWEGHYRTLVDEYGFPSWSEPLQPALVFLQSCLILNEAEALPLLQRGAVGVVGSATRNYSASGGAFSLNFFDALLYEDQSLGGALRQAKNFLLAYALLKEKRLGENGKLGGANLRSAWAFTLWGDPTLKLPRPAPPEQARPAVAHRVKGDTIVLSVPEEKFEPITTDGYKAQTWPNGRLAGLLTRPEDEDSRRLVPLLFAEVSLPKGPPGKTPRLQSRLADRGWVFCWDARRRCGYLLVVPPARAPREIRFQVSWE